MRLISLEIVGFKSFADKTVLRFDGGVTAVVGPNGCGKSNIIDAVRWVLGEQKTRLLRSEKMENVIFNGTEKRRKANLAEVTITFDNNKSRLPTEFTTVSVTRRLFRDGESEYLINDVSCRLKDIHHLFLDTGIGSDSYAIIELGMVEDLLQDKNDSRRQLFEEAAGISKYKTRKKETFQQLEHTELSLTRLEDLLFEIEKNLRSLEKQAKQTEKYFSLKYIYKKLSCQCAVLKTNDVTENQRNIEQIIAKYNQALIDFQKQIEENEIEFHQLALQLQRFETELSEYQQDYTKCNDKIKTIDSEKALYAERVRFLAERQMVLSNQYIGNNQQLEELKTTSIAKEKETVQTEEKWVILKQQLVELDLQYEEAKESIIKQKQTLDNDNQQLKRLENQYQQENRQRDTFTIQLNSLGRELERVENDKVIQQNNIKEVELKQQTIHNELIELENTLNKLHFAQEKLNKEIENKLQLIEKQKETIYQTQRVLDSAEQEFKLVKSLIDSLEGFPDSIKYLQKHKDWDAKIPLVSDIFHCEAVYKIAVETYLEPYLNYFVVSDRVQAMQALSLLKTDNKGRVNCFILNEINQLPIQKVHKYDNLIPLLEIISYPPEYENLANYLFKNAYLTNDSLAIDQYTDIQDKNISIVHISGNSIARNVSLSGGSVGAFEGKRLGRTFHIQQLTKDIQTHNALLNSQQQELHNLTNQLEELKKKNPAQDIEKITQQIVEKKQNISILEVKNSEFQKNLAQISLRANQLSTEINQIQTQFKVLEPQLSEIQQQLSQYQNNNWNLQRNLETQTDAFATLSQQYNQHNLNIVQTENTIQSLKKDYQYLQQQSQQLDNQNIQIQDEIQHIQNEALQLQQQSNQHHSNQETHQIELQSIQNQLNNTTASLQLTKQKILSNQQLQKTILTHKDETQLKQNQSTNDLHQLKIQLNSINERLKVEFETELQQLDNQLLFEKSMSEYNLPQMEKELLATREKLQKFGEINPAAIEQFNEINERYTFIQTQKNDLLDAKTNLLTTISEIDTTAKNQLLQSFNQIREHFISVFQTLFNEGDTCDLLMINPNNPLESPIDIIAKPKGKRPLTINQLSGGEKTLTAISLLFAIYLLKPAPFCIFDEVDAPLDDANIEKFNNIIRDFSKESQFILVTHNKRTIVNANILYGITMQETGVSRILPVDLDALNLNTN